MQLFDNFSAPLHSLFDDTEETKGLLRLLRKQMQSLTTVFLKLKIM